MLSVRGAARRRACTRRVESSRARRRRRAAGGSATPAARDVGRGCRSTWSCPLGCGQIICLDRPLRKHRPLDMRAAEAAKMRPTAKVVCPLCRNVTRRRFHSLRRRGRPALALWRRVSSAWQPRRRSVGARRRHRPRDRRPDVPVARLRHHAVTAPSATARPPAPRRIRKAIAACAAAGGGRVVVPDGRFLTGAVQLKSNVNLHLADKAHARVHRSTRGSIRSSSRAGKASS